MKSAGSGMNVCFMGGRQAGVVGLLALMAAGNKVKAAVSYSPETDRTLRLFRIPVFRSIKSPLFMKALKGSDLLVSVQGREIVSKDTLSIPKFGGINAHPYLYKYKGADPVGRALKDGNYRASVGVHVMTEKLDSGKVLKEEFVDVSGLKTPVEVFNRLYPHYASALMLALGKISRRKKNVGKKPVR